MTESITKNSEGMEHSDWGPSSLSRIATCPGSVRAIREAKRRGDIPEEQSRGYNEQGQAEHDACYAIMTAKDRDAVTAKVFDTVLHGDGEAINRVSFAIEQVDAIITKINETAIFGAPTVLFETKCDPKRFFKNFVKDFDLTRFPVESLEGTTDVGIINTDENEVWVLDYKFGWIDVDIEQNKQLLAYALGLVSYWCIPKNPPKRIITVIIQPQAMEKVKTASYTFAELMDFAVNDYVRYIENSTRDDAPLNPTQEDCLFCDLDGHCRAQHDTAKAEFKKTPVETLPTLSDEELGRVANSLPLIKQWINSVEKACYARQIAGRRIPSRKLVRSTKHRKWTNEQKALKFLAARGISKESREVTKPVSPSKAETLLKKVNMTARAWTMFKRLWEKPEGELISVPIDNPKPEVDLTMEAKKEFEEVEVDANTATKEGPEYSDTENLDMDLFI